ncbi:MAG: hypothetical protein J5739_01775 [Lachnospiraceae bacterium]|nr:hypothetical protein [Lachnospiraceae bacterium]
MKKMLKKIMVCALITASLVALYAVKPADDRTQSISVAVADEPSGTTTPAAGTTTPAAGTTTPAASTTPAANAMPDGITSIQVNYTREEITVTSNAQVYYAPLKKPTDNAVKPADIITAAKVTDSTYIIDISCYSASKDLYLGITNKLSPDMNGLYPVMNCKIPATYKKVVFNINYAAEGAAAAGSGILQNVIVNNTDGTTKTYDHSGTANDNIRPISELTIEWRKGNNCAYSNISTLTPAVWESMKISGAIIYLRLGATDGALGSGQRYSQETKIKLAITKSKELKVDVNKLSVPLANGMQFREKGKTTWITILPFDGKSKTEKAIRDVTLAATPFDPYTEGTSAKVKEMSIEDIFTVSGYVPNESSPTSVEYEYRIAATSKKPASRISTFKIPYQYAGPVVTAQKAGADIAFAAITNAPSDKVSGKYEYTIVDKADITADNIVISQIKWYSIKTGSVLKTGTNIKGTYQRKDGSRKTVNLGDGGSVILVRRCGIKETKKNAAVLASKYTIVDPTNLPATTPAPSGTPEITPNPSGTPETTPNPSGTPETTPNPSDTPATTPNPSDAPATTP